MTGNFISIRCIMFFTLLVPDRCSCHQLDLTLFSCHPARLLARDPVPYHAIKLLL
jgi:hypothetical protein